MLNHPNVSFLFYADDGIIYSDQPFDPIAILDSICKESGIVAHKEAPKSRWIKYDGIWLHPLKFLGRKFIPNTLDSQNLGNVENATRSPKNYVFNMTKVLGLAIEFDN